MSKEPPWRHVRYDYERGAPIHWICHRYALFAGVGAAQLTKRATVERWTRPEPKPGQDWAKPVMLGLDEPLPVVLFDRPRTASTATQSPQDAKPKARTSEPDSRNLTLTPLPKRLPSGTTFKTYLDRDSGLALALGQRFRHFRERANVSRPKLSCGELGVCRFERFESGDWMDLSCVIPLAKHYAKVLGVLPSDLCDVGDPTLNERLQQALFGA